ncbi:MAG: prephenate dehydrogenase [Frankiales bacterium]|nr:prephenate dehydrogenase [Frankiales bacterium]
MPNARWEGRLLVVGTGLIGTSVALAAREAGAQVLLSDADPAQAELAASMGAGQPVAMGELTPDEPLDMVLIAAPPRAIPPIAAAALRSKLGRTVTHVGSVQTHPLVEVELFQAPVRRFAGGHPIAGREQGGPTRAAADLFVERPWVVCPTPSTDEDAVAAVAALARACGARPVAMSPEAHDLLFARLSHVPQLAASALAASLADLAAADVALAGGGLRDTTRIADSDPALWAEIVTANHTAVAAGLRRLAEPLSTLADALEGDVPDAALDLVRDLVERGRAGRRLLPGRHGGSPEPVAVVQVAVPDEPGRLAALLQAVAALGVNLEDLRVEHAPGQPVGFAELSVQPAKAADLARALTAEGWLVVSPGTPG